MYSVCPDDRPAEFRPALVQPRRAGGFGRWLAFCALLTIVAPAREASAAVLQQVQSGTVVSNGNGITSVTIASVDTTKSFLIFQTRTNSGVPGGSTVRGRLQSSTSIQFQRVTAETAPITIQWYLATFGSGVTVQRGEVAQSATTVNVTITSVGSMSQAFVLFSKTAASGDPEWSADDAVAGDLTTVTNLQFRSSTLNAAHTIAWQVIRFTNAADINVQRGTIATMGTTLASVTATLSPAVNVGKTFVLASWRSTGTGGDIGSRMLRARLTSSTQVTIDRSVLGSPDSIPEIWWQAIELKDGSTVWGGSTNFATGVAQATSALGLPDTNVNRAVGFISGQGGNGQSMGRTPYVTSDIIGVGSATVSFTENLVTLDRGNTAATADVAWFVVQFDGGPPFKVGSFTKATATGTQTIAHGLGQQPKAMLLWAEGKSDGISLRGATRRAANGLAGVTTSDAIAYGDGTTATTTVSTTSFNTTAPDELFLAFVSASGSLGQTVTGVSGGGLTWVLVVRANAQPGTSEVWRAYSAVPLTGVTVTATLAQAATSSITVMTVADVDQTGANGAGAIGATKAASSASGAPTGFVTTTRNGSGVAGVGNDPTAAASRTAPANQFVVHQYMPTGRTFWMQAIAAPVATSGTVATINDTAPAGNAYNLAIVEILPRLTDTVTLDVPAGTTADDVMIATIGVRPSSAIVTATPAGWTQVRRTNNATGSTNSLITYYRVATASEPADYTWSFDATTGIAGGILSFVGVDTTSPINVENGQTTASSFTHVAPAVTTTVAKTMIVTAHTFSSSGTWSPVPTGLTEAVDLASEAVPDSVGQSLSVNYGLRAAAGLTPTYTATAVSTAGNQDVGATETLALRPASHIYYSLGMTDGTTSRSVSSSSADAAGVSNASSRTATKAITMVRSLGASGIVVAEADLTSWNDTNVVFDWTTNDAATTEVHYVVFGGTDLSAKVIGWTTGTGTGNRAVTGVGFQPNLVISAHAGDQQVSAPPSTMANGAFGFGVMSAQGTQWANGFLTLDNGGTTDTQRGQRTDAFLYAFDQSLAVQKKASFVSMDANGFTANITTAGSANDMQVFSLALEGLNATVGSFNKSVGAAPASQAITGVNFKPGAVLFSSFQDVTQSGLTPVAQARYGLGASDGTTDGASTFEDLDAAGTSDIGGTDKTTKAFIKVNNSTSTVNAEADLTTMDADGFTLNWTTNDAVATEILYLAMGPMAVTEVTMIATTATVYPSGVLVQWTTGYERDNLGFNVYREVNGIRTKVNGSPITGSGIQAGPGHAVNGQLSYARWDLAGVALSASAYWLEDLDFNGTSKFWPITLTVSTLQEPSIDDSGELDQINDDTYYIRRIFFSVADDPSQLGPRVAEPQLPQEVATQWELGAASGAVKIGIRKPGWYRIAQTDLVAAGLSPQAERQKLQLFVNGAEQAIGIIGGAVGTFSPSDSIEFYAFGADTAFTDTRVYWLRAGDQDGRRIAVDGGGTFDPSSETVFSSRLRRKDRGVYIEAVNNGDAENWFGPMVDPSAPATLSLTSNHVDQTSPAQLSVKLQGVSVSSSTPHSVGVAVNGTTVGQMTFDGQALADESFVVPAGVLNDGENLVRLETAGGDDRSLVDSITLDYPHSYRADADRLRFVVEAPASIAIDGFASGSIRVFDITNRETPVQLQTTVAIVSGLVTVTAQVAGSGPRTLFAFSDQTLLAPAFVRANHASTLHATTNAYDYVAVSHADFVPALAPLAALRQQQGLRPVVVDVEDIYDEFSFGQKTPQAIRDFLQWAKVKWATAPKFVLLAGDATVDPRDYSGRGDVDFVPTKAVPMTEKTGEMPSDDWFVDYNDDGLPDAAIGRLSIRTLEQAEAVVAKIVNYDPASQQPWTKEVLLVADRTDGTTDFELSTGALGALVPAGYTANQLRLRALGDVAAHDALVNSVNDGQLIVNYSGHGSVGLWNNGLLVNADVASWNNAARLPFVVAMNCLTGLFNQSFDEESLAEALQRAANGGAVAVWASSTDTAPATQALANQELLRLIFAGTYSTLGEAVAAAKRVVANQDLRRSWIFFGDPAMRLAGQFPVAGSSAPPTPPHPYVEDPAPPSDPAPDPSPASAAPAPPAAPAAETPAAAPAPGAPSLLTSSVFGTTLVLTWAPAASGAAPGWYVIEAGSFTGGRDFVQPTGNIATSFTVENVQSGTYFVRVRAASAAGESAASNEVIVVIGGGSTGPQGSGAPAPPTELVASVNGSSVTFAWRASTFGGTPETYRIEAGSSFGASDLATFSTGNAATVAFVPGVPAGTYYVRIHAANAAGTSAPSNEVVVFVSGSTACSLPPDAPSGLGSTVSGSTVFLGWNGAAGSPTSYILEAASHPGAADLLVSDTGNTATAMVAREVTSGTYFVRVFARNACGVSGPSSEIVVVVP